MSEPFRNRISKKKIKYARKLRRNATQSEEILWNEIKDRKLGVKFRFQAPILGWIVDFWCPSKKLIIELDGIFHKDTKEKDAYRDKVITEYLKARVLRIASSEVFKDLGGCIEKITWNSIKSINATV